MGQFLKNQSSRLLYALSYSWKSVLFVGLVIFAKSWTDLLLWAEFFQSDAGKAVLDFVFWAACSLFGFEMTKTWNIYPDKTFRHVFGDGFAEREHLISIPSFNLNPDCRKLLNDNDLTSARHIFNPSNVQNIFGGGDIQKIVASSDIVGARYLIDRMGRHSCKGPQLNFGEDLTVTRKDFVAMGLQTNPNTPYFFNTLTSEYEKTLLCRSRKPATDFPSPVPAEVIALDDFQKCTLEPTEDNLGANICITKTNGESILISTGKMEPWNIGLLMIIRIKDSQLGEYRRILCGGVGPGGTTGSAYYLSHKWARFGKLVHPSSEYDAIVSFTYTPCQWETNPPIIDEICARDAETIELIRFGLKRKA